MCFEGWFRAGMPGLRVVCLGVIPRGTVLVGWASARTSHCITAGRTVCFEGWFRAGMPGLRVVCLGVIPRGTVLVGWASARTSYFITAGRTVCFEGWFRAGMTRGTKVGWVRQIDFSSLKNIVFLQYGAEQECSGYIFVLGVRIAGITCLVSRVIAVSVNLTVAGHQR